jgi:hypothetical protein
MFETDKEVLDWYEKQPRALTKEFVDSICWRDVSNYALNSEYVPVLIYMRDIEYLTDMYYRELLRTPIGKDPIIRKFMDRWSIDLPEWIADILSASVRKHAPTSAHHAPARSRFALRRTGCPRSEPSPANELS